MLPSDDAPGPGDAPWSAFAEAAPDLCAVVGPDGRLARVNARFASVRGEAADRLVGRALPDLVPPRERAALAEALAACRAGAEGEIDLHLVGVGGALVRVGWRGRPVADTGRVAVVGRLAVRRAPRVLPLRRLVTGAADLLALHRPDGTWLWANAASERALGFAPEELVGRSLADFLHPADRLVFHRRALAPLAAGAASVRLTCHLAAPGGWTRYDLVLTPVRGLDGALLRVQSAARPRAAGRLAGRARRRVRPPRRPGTR